MHACAPACRSLLMLQKNTCPHATRMRACVHIADAVALDALPVFAADEAKEQARIRAQRVLVEQAEAKAKV